MSLGWRVKRICWERLVQVLDPKHACRHQPHNLGNEVWAFPGGLVVKDSVVLLLGTSTCCGCAPPKKKKRKEVCIWKSVHCYPQWSVHLHPGGSGDTGHPRVRSLVQRREGAVLGRCRPYSPKVLPAEAHSPVLVTAQWSPLPPPAPRRGSDWVPRPHLGH